jgi:arylsulfatase A-like enzyme
MQMLLKEELENVGGKNIRKVSMEKFNAKGTVFEGSQGMPELVYWEGVIDPDRACDEFIVVFDLYSTLMNLV